MRTCRESWLKLMERMDARRVETSEPPDDGDAEWNAHRSQCADCREAWAQSRVLLQALETAPSAAPAPPAGFADRTLELWRAENANVNAPRPERRPRLRFAAPRPRARIWLSLAASAAAILAVAIGLDRNPQQLADVPRPVAEAHVRPIDQAVASAGTATLDLAKETSAPVLRVGQRMFRSASFPRLPAISLPLMNYPAASESPPSESPPASSSDPARRVIRLLRGSKS